MFLLCHCTPEATRTLMPSPGIYPSPPPILLIKLLLMSWTSPPECFRELEQSTIFLYPRGECEVLTAKEARTLGHSQSASQWKTQLHVPDGRTEALSTVGHRHA